MTGHNEPPKPADGTDSAKNIIADRYRLVSRLGRGASGQVFKAVDLQQDGAEVAVKVLTPVDTQDSTQVRRFEREVAVCREIDHPNVVKVFDFGAARGRQFVVMELVSGGTLSSRIYDKEKPLTFPEVLFILRDVAAGVCAAHEHGIVHRDLKPDNILLTAEGRAKVTDFGLARDLVVGQTLTLSVETVGTPYYMAPEQFRNHRVDTRADIYSLGIIAFEMINRKRPFVYEVYTDLARAHMTEDIPAFYDKRSEVPKWFETFVWRCGEKRPKARFSSMTDIEKYLTHRLRKMKLLEGEPEQEHFLARLFAKLMGED